MRYITCFITAILYNSYTICINITRIMQLYIQYRIKTKIIVKHRYCTMSSYVIIKCEERSPRKLYRVGMDFQRTFFVSAPLLMDRTIFNKSFSPLL